MSIPKMVTVIEEMCCTDAEKRLFRAVMRQLHSTWAEVWEYPMDYRTADTGIGGFIYYSETHKFAKKNIEEITEVLADFEYDLGEPLKKDTSNMLNWYAWFALEWTIDKVIYYKDSLDN